VLRLSRQVWHAGPPIAALTQDSPRKGSAFKSVGQSITVAFSAMTAGAALKAFLIFQSSECCVDVKTPGGSGSLTGSGSSGRAGVASALSPNKSMNIRFMAFFLLCLMAWSANLGQEL
jgi:hypothetical protein